MHNFLRVRFHFWIVCCMYVQSSNQCFWWMTNGKRRKQNHGASELATLRKKKLLYHRFHNKIIIHQTLILMNYDDVNIQLKAWEWLTENFVPERFLALLLFYFHFASPKGTSAIDNRTTENIIRQSVNNHMENPVNDFNAKP